MDCRTGTRRRGSCSSCWASSPSSPATGGAGWTTAGGLYSIADGLYLVTAGTLSPATAHQMLLAILTGQAKCLGFSIGLATAGYIAYILLPSGPREEDEPPSGEGG